MKIQDENSALECINYIVELELDDFMENPSDNHIYYKAYVALFGVKIANIELDEAIESLEE